VPLVASVAVLGACAGDPPQAPRIPDQGDQRLPGREVLRADFETGGLQQWAGGQAVDDDRIQVVRDPVNQGRYAGRFEVRDGDNPIGYGDRAEVQLSSGETEGQERWYGWSTMFASDFPVTDAWQVVTQWHSEVDGPPPLAFYVEDDRFILRTNRYESDASSAGDPIDHWSAPLRRGVWYRMKLHVRWSGDDDVGFLELWVNGRRVTERVRTRTLFPGHRSFFKQGYYRRSGEPQTGVVYHDGFHASEVTAAAKS
jgi:hypothetical protein